MSTQCGRHKRFLQGQFLSVLKSFLNAWIFMEANTLTLLNYSYCGDWLIDTNPFNREFFMAYLSFLVQLQTYRTKMNLKNI